jgi:hypothetical protein
VALAEESRRRAWWQQVDLSDAYRTLIGMEQVAQTVSEYHVSVVPGLLQTPEYARVVASVGDAEVDPSVDAERIERAVEVRIRRQEILERHPPPRLAVVIDEAVLARGPRDIDVRRRQLLHLRQAADRSNITVQVIGFEYGLHTPATSNFILLDMSDGLPDLFYSQDVRGDFASSDLDVVARNRRVWNELRAKALDVFAAKERIDRYIRDLP